MKDKKAGNAKAGSRDPLGADVVRKNAAVSNQYQSQFDMRMPTQGNAYEKGKLNMRVQQQTIERPKSSAAGGGGQPKKKDNRAQRPYSYNAMSSMDKVRETAYDNLDERSELHEPVADFYRAPPGNAKYHRDARDRRSAPHVRRVCPRRDN